MESILPFYQDLMATLRDVLPGLLAAIVVLLLGYVLARLLRRLVRRALLYLDRRAQIRVKGRTIEFNLRSSAGIIGGAFFWTVLVIAGLLAIHILQLDILNRLLDRTILYLPNVVVAVIILFIGVVAGRMARDVLRAATQHTQRSFVGVAVQYFIVLIAIVVASDQLGVQTDFLTDVIDIFLAMLLFGAALAFGLGAREAVRNILGAYYARKDHKIGTRIRCGDITGVIVKISDHAIHIETAEGRMILPAHRFNDSDILILRDDHD